MKSFNIKIVALSMAFLFCFLIGANSSFAKAKKEADLNTQDTQKLQNVLNSDFKMPTDEEIKAVLNQFDFSEKQKEYLLKETKKTIEEMDKTNLK